MAKHDDQVLLAWEEWVTETGETAGNPDAFMEWAIAKKKIALSMVDVYKATRKRVTNALRQATRIDDDGITYRAKQCAIIFELGGQIPMWFDTDTGGTPTLRQKAARQRRDFIANDVYRAGCDIEHMNKQHGEDIQFVMDFTEDYRERRAADALQFEQEDVA